MRGENARQSTPVVAHVSMLAINTKHTHKHDEGRSIKQHQAGMLYLIGHAEEDELDCMLDGTAVGVVDTAAIDIRPTSPWHDENVKSKMALRETLAPKAA
jgi:hypothetical protein